MAAKKTTSKKALAKKPAAKTKKRVKPIPDNYPVVCARLRVRGGEAALAYYAKAFGAKTRMRLDMPDGRVGHAEIKIGKGLVMLSDEFPENNSLGPQTVGGAGVALHLYVKDVDGTLARAVAAGGTLVRPAQDEFYGDRSAILEDPFGHVWMIQTHVEDVTPAQMKRRLADMFKKA